MVINCSGGDLGVVEVFGVALPVVPRLFPHHGILFQEHDSIRASVIETIREHE